MIEMKKIWLVLLPMLTIATVGGCYYLYDHTAGGPPPQYIMQTITTDAKTSRTITWQTAPSEVAQELVYRKAGAAATEEVLLPVQAKELPTSAEPMSVYTATLTKLAPETAYEYRVGGKNNWSEWYCFTTEEAEIAGFKAIIFGDSQSEDYGVWAKTAQTAWSNHPDARFFINMGDLVDIGSHYDQWKSWLNGAANMISAIPAAPISGNHENYLPGGAFSPATLYLSLFRLPENGPETLNGQAYSFDYGAVHFVALDSQEEELSGFQPELIDKQAKWLEKDLARSSKPWKVVVIHRSLFKNSDSGEENELGKRFIPIFDRHRVDAVFTAHIHTYGRSEPLYQGKIVGDAADGTVYLSTGRSGDKTWAGSKRKYFETVFDRSLDQPNYLLLEAGMHQMRVTNFKQDGTQVDSVQLSK